MLLKRQMCPYSVYGMDCSRFTQRGYFPNIHLYHWFLAIWTISQRVLFSSFYSAWDLLSFWNLYIKVILVRYSIIHYPKMGWLKKKTPFMIHDSSDLWSFGSGSLPRLQSNVGKDSSQLSIWVGQDLLLGSLRHLLAVLYSLLVVDWGPQLLTG